MPVAVSFFGDAASNQGVVHEAMNPGIRMEAACDLRL